MNTKSDPLRKRNTATTAYLSGWRLWIAWATWFAIASMVFYATVASTSQFVSAALHGGALTEKILQGGIAPSIFFPLDFILDIIQQGIWCLVALFVFWKRSRDWMALVTSSMILVVGYFMTTFKSAIVPGHITPNLVFLDTFIWFLDIVNYGCVLLFYGTFPNGRFVLRWLRPAFIALFIFVAVDDIHIVLDPRIEMYSGLSIFIRFVALSILLIFAQLYRLSHSSAVQRQQTKLAVTGLVMGVIGNMMDKLVLLHYGQSVYLIARPITSFLFIGAAVCFTYAILRYHLWDIDFAINRSLVYGLLTALLGVIFAGGFFTLRVALESLFGRQQDLIAVAVPAVAITALFTPTRNGLRRFVDRRFYGIELDYRKVVEEQAMKQKRQQLSGALIDSFGSYKNLELVGRGGMSEVYRTRHTTLDCDVAVKILSQNLVEDEIARKRFNHEARAISMISHPNIEKLYEYNEQDGVPYIVLEFLEGQALSQMLRNKGRLLLQEALPILRDIASALDYAHARGIVHRDIKPSNVIVRQKSDAAGEKIPHAMLTDFGIAKLYDVTHLTSSGSLLGTLDYVSPEQIHGASEVDARSDIYSFGVMAYELLTGVLPFEHRNPGALVMAHLMQPAPDPRTKVPDLPATVAKALMRAMAKDPRARQNTAGELVKDMECSSQDRRETSLTQAPEPLRGMA